MVIELRNNKLESEALMISLTQDLYMLQETMNIRLAIWDKIIAMTV